MKDQWSIETRNAGQAFLKLLVKEGHEKEAKQLLGLLKSKTFTLDVAMFIHHINILIEASQRLDC